MFNPKHKWVFSKNTLDKYIPSIVVTPNIIGIKKDNLMLKKIEYYKASNIIIKNHYSHKTATRSHTLLNIGIYLNDKCIGAMQYGYAMNPLSCTSIVSDTKVDEYYELNRLWIDDIAGKNTESQVIGMSFRLIKEVNPKIKWIQSFADGRVGVGTIYQATNFLYCGSHKQKFVSFNGETHHIGKFTNKQKTFGRMFGNLLPTLPNNEYQQYRYIYFLDKEWEKKLLLPIKPYPKK